MARENFAFSMVPSAEIPRSAFARNHGHKTMLNAGDIIPLYVDEVLPGDTFNLSTAVFARLATPIVPVMDNLFLDFFFFFVPNRLLWSNWQRFMGEQDNPGDSTDFLVPIVSNPAAWEVGSLGDYFGLPINAGNQDVSALWFRAYNLIWNEWFRDQNLQDSAVKNVDDGPDAVADYPIRKRCKRHDYFTSALPFLQKGTAALVPLGTSAPVIANPNDPLMRLAWADATATAIQGTGGTTNLSATVAVPAGPNQLLAFRQGYASPGNSNAGLMADLSESVGPTVNTLRQAFQVQKLLERDARGGTRYIELLKSHFGVTSPDARLQRPEYLGGGSVPVFINPVSKTSSTDGTSPQGFQAGYGVAAGRGIGFSKSFVEHGVLLGLASIRSEQTYQQGIPKMFARRTRYDFYWPAFAHLGEQAILNREIYYQDDEADNAVFGYQERWAEYRYFPSKVTGLMRSEAPSTLHYWHLAQNFVALPTLNEDFIVENPPMARVKAVTSEPDFIVDAHFSLRCVRPMPTYSVPGLTDHF